MLKHFPVTREVSRVFSLVIFIVYTWSIFRYLYQLPSWFLAHNIKEIAIYTAYICATSLIESVLIFLFIFVIGAIFPKRYYWGKFTTVGCLTAIVIASWGLVLQSQKPNLLDYDISNILEILVFFLLSILSAIILGNILHVKAQKFVKIIKDFTERSIIFIWLYPPIGFISLVYVIFRIV